MAENKPAENDSNLQGCPPREDAGVDRRQVLKQSIAAATVGVFAASGESLLARDKLSRRTSNYSFSEDMWADLVGTRFRIMNASNHEELDESTNRLVQGRQLELIQTKTLLLETTPTALGI